MTFFKQVHVAIENAASWLERDQPELSENEQFVRTWHLTLLTVAADIAPTAVSAASNESTRAARILNRSLLEYGCRAHHYHRAPDKAAVDGLFAQNMGRKIMHPTRDIKGKMSDEQFTGFKSFMNSGDRDVPFPAVQAMMKDALRNFGLNGSTTRKVMRWLDVEYTIGSGIIHGSQAAILDSFIKAPSGIERLAKTPHFTAKDEISRTILALLFLLAAVEMHYNMDFTARMLVSDFHQQFDDDSTTTIWRHDALKSVL